LLDRALSETSSEWPPIRVAFGWVHQAAHILANPEATDGAGVRRRLGGLLGAMSRHRTKAGKHAGTVGHFVKVSRSYWPGLFHSYDRADLPRTNNDLEQFFGRHRYHERRATGRKGGSPSLVLRGSVRLVAASATRARIYSARDIEKADRERWASLRGELDARRDRRTQRRRFRRSPDEYLRSLEQTLIQSTLPA
jgi:hypothetical protein